jgi:NAD(P)H-dependent flavin oxidoreductase YrpB (nitropropane dioxygenase family)
MPLQSIVSENVLRRLDILAEKGNEGAREMTTYWVGQGVGLMNKVKPAREVVLEMIEDYLDAAERITNSLED